MEKEKYLYPGKSIKPVNVGDGFEDYLLSDILNNAGIPFLSGRMEFSAEKVEFVGRYPVLKAYCIAVVRCGVDTFMAFAPIARCRPYKETIEEIRSIDTRNNIKPTEMFTDLVVRYYMKDGNILRPVWVEAMVENGEGNRRHSAFGFTDYCTELISGPLVTYVGDGPALPINSSYLSEI